MLACHASAFTYTFRKEVSTRAYLPALPNQRLDTSRCAGCSDFLRTQSNTKADAVNAVAALHHAQRTKACVQPIHPIILNVGGLTLVAISWTHDEIPWPTSCGHGCTSKHGAHHGIYLSIGVTGVT